MVQQYVFFSIHYPDKNILIAKFPSLPVQVYSILLCCETLEKHPPPTFCPISCIGLKFTQMSAHPGASFVRLIQCTR